MTAATATRVPATVGNGKAVHAATDRHDGYGLSVSCGAVRYRNITSRTITRQPAGTAITCSKCLNALPETVAPFEVPEGVPAVVPSAEPFTAQLQAEAAAKRAVPAAAPRDEVTATVTEEPAVEGPRYTAVRAEGRNKVLDRVTGKYTTCASRVAAEEKAAKLNRQHEAEARHADADAAVAAFYDNFRESRRGLDKAIRDRLEVRPATPREEAIDALADSVRDGAVSFTDAVGSILGVPVAPVTSLGRKAAAAKASEDAPRRATKAPRPAKATKADAPAEKPAKLFSVWVGHRIADTLMPKADAEPGTDLGEVGRKLREAKQGRRLARTIRVTPAEREALSGYATQVENDAVAGKDAPLADSARTLRGRLA